MSSPLSRRTFLGASAVLASQPSRAWSTELGITKPGRSALPGESLEAAGFRLDAAEPSFVFPPDAPHRLAVSTYPFRDFIAPTVKHSAKAQKLSEFATGIVDKFGVYGIEPWSRHFESTEHGYVDRLRAAFDKAQLQVVNIPCDVNVRACGTPEQRSEAQRKWRAWVDVAQALGSPSIRVHVEPPKTGEFLPAAIEALKQIGDYGAQKNVVINLENDDPRSEDPAVIANLLKGVQSKWVRSLPDFCNSMFIQNDQDYNAKALGTLFPLAYNISHVKDSEVGDGKTTRVDVNRLFGVAKSAGYRGFFSMEYEGGADPYEGSSKLIAASLKSLAS